MSRGAHRGLAQRRVRLHQRLCGVRAATLAAVFGMLLCCLLLSACGGSGSSADGSAGANGAPSGGEPFNPTFAEVSYDPSKLLGSSSAGVDVSHGNQGYVMAVGQAAARMKLQVVQDQVTYNYDLPNDGTPTAYPLNAGDGTYRIAVLKNTSGSRYVELFSCTADVSMDSEFEPFLRSTYYCSYTEKSACVALARKLTAEAQTQAEALSLVYDYIVSNISYDVEKAEELSGGTGYVPDPDQTLQEKSGICSDYAALAAAMLRSQGIPTKVIMGYVSPGDVYHAWNMVYVDGSWQTVGVDVKAGTWSRIDPTFAASGSSPTSGDGLEYADRYTY